ncbi:hypothetical protein ACFRFL_11290 [Streptomyces sp. NPDC056708]|uniref:hypothetical protein n=1 Tax=unclassified Streptomyces TaxID=2593676 RepID=UPI00369DF869
MTPLLLLSAAALCGYLWAKARKKPPQTAQSTPGPPEATAELGLVPPDELDTADACAPDPRDEEIRATVRSGDWRAGAAFLDEAGRDWQERYRRAAVLQDEAAADDAWLLAWRAARPKDAGAALVHAGVDRRRRAGH